MKSLICVECHADRYFFGRLVNDANLIRKEKNKNEVIKAITQRVKDQFIIGVVDEDKNDLLKDKNLSDFEKILEEDAYKIFKHKTNFQFIFVLRPKEFEFWLNEFLKLKNKTIQDFGYIDLEEFTKKESKSIKPESYPRFKEVITFVINSHSEDVNFIYKMKKKLEYLIEKKYTFDKNEFLNV